MPRAQSFHPHCLKPIEKYLPRCLALILFTCCLTSLASPPAGGRLGESAPGSRGTDTTSTTNAQILAGTAGGCATPSFWNPNASSYSGSFAADFNGDGKLDLAGLSFIALGNGDGTFQAPVNFNVGYDLAYSTISPIL